MADFLSSVAPQITKVIKMIVESELVNRTITYRLHAGESYNASLGYATTTFTEYTDLDAARIAHSVDSVAALQGSGVEVGDWMYLMKDEDIPDNISLKDEIQDGVMTLQIIHIQHLLDFGALFTVKSQ